MLTSLLPYIYTITSTICFVIMQVMYKMLTQVLPQSIVLSTQAFFLLCLNSYILTSQQSYKHSYSNYLYLVDTSKDHQISAPQPQNDQRFQINVKDPAVFYLLLKRLVTNCLSVCVVSMALQRIPLSIVNSLLNTGPIMVFFVEAYFYKKPLSKVHLTLTVVSFIGVLIIVNPFNALLEQKNQQFFDMLLPIIGAAFASIGFIYLHDLKGKVNQFIMLEYSYMAQVLFFNFLTNFSAHDMVSLQTSNQTQSYFEASITDPYCVGAFLTSVILAYTANYCRVKALFMLPPSKIIPMNYVGIVLSLTIDVTFFGYKTGYVEILGILLTSVGLLSHLVLELIQSEESKQKNQNK